MLTREDFESTTWIRLSEIMSARLANLRVALETPADEVRTATLRGQIKEIRFLLALRNEAPQNDVAP